jgi:hypothetical protein
MSYVFLVLVWLSVYMCVVYIVWTWILSAMGVYCVVVSLCDLDFFWNMRFIIMYLWCGAKINLDSNSVFKYVLSHCITWLPVGSMFPERTYPTIFQPPHHIPLHQPHHTIQHLTHTSIIHHQQNKFHQETRYKQVTIKCIRTYLNIETESKSLIFTPHQRYVIIYISYFRTNPVHKKQRQYTPSTLNIQIHRK